MTIHYNLEYSSEVLQAVFPDTFLGRLSALGFRIWLVLAGDRIIEVTK